MKIIIGNIGYKGIRIPNSLGKWIIRYSKGKYLSNHILVDGNMFRKDLSLILLGLKSRKRMDIVDIAFKKFYYRF